MRLRTGLEVEVGIGSIAWASTAPVDDGTAEVLAGGLRPLYDPDGHLQQLVDTVARRF